MRVAILPTGRMEIEGLRHALVAIFPAHEFDNIYKRRGHKEPFDSFTSPGRTLRLMKPNGNVDKIVERMASELVPGRGGQAPDLLLVLEDLELPNKHQPEIVVQIFREATQRHVEALGRTNPRFAEKVRDALLWKASFHLAVPMIEAWLFADPSGPRNAGVPPDRLPPSWESDRDPEDFLTRDPAYLADDCSACTAWHALSSKERQDEHKPGWLKEQRELHPKAFLAWLCRDPAEKNCSRYRETHEGASALRSLDWAATLRTPDHATYLRALVEDLAEGLGERPIVPVEGRVAAATSRRERRESPVLRNI